MFCLCRLCASSIITALLWVSSVSLEQMDRLFATFKPPISLFSLSQGMIGSPPQIAAISSAKEATMLGDYLSPSFENAIEARCGESVVVLDADAHPQWLLVRNAGGAVGYVPRSGVAGYGADGGGYVPPVVEVSTDNESNPVTAL